MDKTILNILLICFVLVGCKDKTEEHFIDYNNHKSVKQFAAADEFYFVGETKLNPGVYRYNFAAKKSTLIWNSRTEKVIDLVSYEDMKTVFFITAVRYGLAGAFPFVENARLYRIDPETRKAEFLSDIGNAIQLYSYWSEEVNFNLLINSFDPKINTYVIQNKQLYNQFGRIMSDHSETSDLLISGYPIFKPKEIKSTSYNGQYKLFSISDSVFIRDLKNKSKSLVQATDHRINEIEWIPERSLMVFSTTGSTNTDKAAENDLASLNIFNTNEKSIVETFSGSSLYRFAITNEFLIFDSGFSRNSKIHIINLSDLSGYDVIKITGGCGLRNIP